MSFHLPIPRGGISRSSEVSRLISGRDPSSLGHLWKPVLNHAYHANSTNNNAGALQRQLSKFQQQATATNSISFFHPFKIYQVPFRYRVYKPSNAWQRFKVRGGLMGQYDVKGTDRLMHQVGFGDDTNGSAQYENFLNYISSDGFGGYEKQTYQVAPPTQAIDDENPQNGWNEVAVPADGALYYFWITVTSNHASSGPVVCFGNDPSACQDMDSGGGGTFSDFWPGFPEPDPYHWLIGSIFYNGTGYTIAQMLYENIRCYPFGSFNSSLARPRVGPMRFCGDYSATQYYWCGDTVTNTETDGAGKHYLLQYSYLPTVVSTYNILNGPIINIDPKTHTPDPWFMLSKSPIDASYVTGAYDASKYYLRTA